MKTKCIHYAYPTSPAAKALGYPLSGCYYVTVGEDNHLSTEGARAFASLPQAEHYASSVEVPFHDHSIKPLGS